jgi:hypothetical protein
MSFTMSTVKRFAAGAIAIGALAASVALTTAAVTSASAAGDGAVASNATPIVLASDTTPRTGTTSRTFPRTHG